MAITADQFAPANSTVGNNGAALTVTFGANPAAQATILVGMWVETQLGLVDTLTDNGGNTYTQDILWRAGIITATVFVWRSTNIPLKMPGSGTLQVTMTFGGNNPNAFRGFAARSYLGMQGRVDNSGGNATNATGVFTISETIAPNTSSCLFFSVYGNTTGASGANPSVASPFSKVTSWDTGISAEVGAIGEFIATDKNAQTATWTTLATEYPYTYLVTYPPSVPIVAPEIVVPSWAVTRSYHY